MRPHHKLDAWNMAIEFVVDIYKATESFPKEKRYGLTSQIRRAAVLIPANIAEGAGRYSNREFAHFLSNAQGSASELETELIISNKLGYLNDQAHLRSMAPLDRIGRLITGLSKTLPENRKTFGRFTIYDSPFTNHGFATKKKHTRIDRLYRQR